MVNSLSRLGRPEAHDVARETLDRLGRVDDEEVRWPQLGEEPAPGGVPWQDIASSAASERWCLTASDLMHKAADLDVAPPTDANERRKLLEGAANFFTAGYRSKLHPPRDHVDRRAFALSNAMLCTALATLSSGRTRLRKSVRACWEGHSNETGWRQAALDLLAETARGGLAKFWHYTNTMELLTSSNLLALLALRTDEDAARNDALNDLDRKIAAALDEAFAMLCKALERWPSPSERESLQHRYRLLHSVLDPLLKKKSRTRREQLMSGLLKRFDDLTERALSRLTCRPDGSAV